MADLTATPAFDETYGGVRLPQDCRPMLYKLHLAPDLTTFRFDATLEIVMTVARSCDQILLNACDLDIASASLTVRYFEHHLVHVAVASR
jgi:hypothetical protein